MLYGIGNTLLSVYIAELACNVHREHFCTIKAMAQFVGRVMGLSVVAQKILLLDNSKITDCKWHDIFNGPVDLTGLFGVALDNLKARVELRCKDKEMYITFSLFKD